MPIVEYSNIANNFDGRISLERNCMCKLRRNLTQVKKDTVRLNWP